MPHLLKKLKLYIKLGPERVHKAPISIQIKIFLWSFVDDQHLQNYFYSWNIILNYCFIYKMNIRGNFIWKCPWPERALFLKKGHQQFYPIPYSIPFISVLHRNKALYNFRKRWQHSIVEHNIGLEYALLVVSNSHISTTLPNPLWKM